MTIPTESETHAAALAALAAELALTMELIVEATVATAKSNGRLSCGVLFKQSEMSEAQVIAIKNAWAAQGHTVGYEAATGSQAYWALEIVWTA